MLTFRNVIAVGLFLFGTTFLWMTASFTGKNPPPQGAVWTIENALAMLAIVGFTATAWGVYKDLDWWEAAAIVSAIVGLIAVVPFAVGTSEVTGFADLGVQINLVMHAGGSALVLALLVIPGAHDWVGQRL